MFHVQYLSYITVYYYFIDEEGEADSFVGQGPEPGSNPFQNVTNSSDPFANVGHNPFPPPMPSSVPQRFNSQTPPLRSSPVPGGHSKPGMGTPGQIPRPGIPPPSGKA